MSYSNKLTLGIFVFLVLTIIFSQNENYTVIAEEPESKFPNLVKSPSSYTSKVDPLIIAWQVETNQEEFAKNNNISYSNGKIGVYIYLDDQSSISKIPSDVEITATDANIVVAMVTSSQIDQLAQIDSINKISLPKLLQPHADSTLILNKKDSSEKIDSKIIAWQVETNQEEFAKNNNISYSNGKIGVYIYLDDQSSISKIPSDVEITATDANIVVAMVTSSQIDQLAQIDSINKISLPKEVTNPIIPTNSSEEISVDDNYILLISVVIGIAIAIGISFKVYKKKISQ